MEEHRKLKEDADIKYDFFKMMVVLHLMTMEEFMPVIVDRVLLKHNLSGGKWDDR